VQDSTPTSPSAPTGYLSFEVKHLQKIANHKYIKRQKKKEEEEKKNSDNFILFQLHAFEPFLQLILYSTCRRVSSSPSLFFPGGFFIFKLTFRLPIKKMNEKEYRKTCVP
jgi:hypothetical protein